MSTGTRRTKFAAALRRWRIERGWSQHELAERSGMSSAFISNLENGHGHPTRDSYRRLTQAVGAALPKPRGMRASGGGQKVTGRIVIFSPKAAGEQPRLPVGNGKAGPPTPAAAAPITVTGEDAHRLVALQRRILALCPNDYALVEMLLDRLDEGEKS